MCRSTELQGQLGQLGIATCARGLFSYLRIRVYVSYSLPAAGNVGCVFSGRGALLLDTLCR